MGTEGFYGRLMESAGEGGERFDTHVAASILALGMEEARREGTTLSARLGLDAAALRRMAATLFPGAQDMLAGFVLEEALAVDAEEQSVRDVLWMSAAAATGFERDLACMVARRCLRPNHLWQDLGLRNRGELSRLMREHFPVLAQRNRNDMKWKKFLYRTICASEGFSLCAAPVCTECDDFAACFGAEDGDPLVARMRRDNAAPAPP
ncbi:nitrogen fixation protein NifQ [Paracraurococcus lichenis]|uniref:Nitrogen fixation protein NifQ n=1 Tax=Paracraurococcus lichenis TaxID=3064888 RepID=A0ABT9DYE4_9PROT|nr:nitrogen fixation protein NifQ [Paracraurococcus sp. LOR1-02]MDO9708925.1 nitrogen fixation protein NifQ [Paracraurococcus sp. LOR1-02]